MSSAAFIKAEVERRLLHRFPAEFGVKGRPANAAGERHNVTAIRKRMIQAPVAQGREGAKAKRSAASSAGSGTFALGIERRGAANAKRCERLFREMRRLRVLVVEELQQDVSSFRRLCRRHRRASSLPSGTDA